MHSFDDSERLRTQAYEQDADLSRDGQPSDGCAQGLAAQTVTISVYPTTANAFYGVKTLVVTGTETEGSPATTGTSGKAFLAYNLGSGIPPVGTQVQVTRVPWRWVFRFDSAGTTQTKQGAPIVAGGGAQAGIPPAVLARPRRAYLKGSLLIV